jgi:hypothetical protein
MKEALFAPEQFEEGPYGLTTPGFVGVGIEEGGSGGGMGGESSSPMALEAQLEGSYEGRGRL